MGVVDRRNYEKRGYQRLLWGVYGQATESANDIWSSRRAVWLDKVKAVMALYASQRPILFGPTALQLLPVALPESVADWENVHILLPSAGERPRRKGVMSHCMNRSPEVWRVLSGMPVLHPVDHWLQLTGATVDAMVEIGDGFLRRKNPLLSMESMLDRLATLKGAQRFGLAQKAMHYVRPDTDSLYETRTRLMLIHAGLETPEVNFPVWCPLIDATYHVDMGYPTVKVAVEYDGLVHVQDREQMSIDADRRRNLQDEGWLIITVTAKQLHNPAAVIRSVESALLLRGWTPKGPARRR